jgi:hypothetical protein
MDVRSLLVPDSKSAKLINPGKTSFHYPSPPTKTTAVFGVAHREQSYDATVAQTLPNCLCVKTAIAQYTIRPVAWTSPQSLQCWDGINERDGLLRVVTIRASKLYG